MAGRETFGAWLMSRRRALGLTRDELAALAGCAPITVEKIERGERKPSEQVLNLLLSAVGVPPDRHLLLLRFARGEIGADEVESALLEQGRPPATNLPASLTLLLGREGEVAAAVALLLRSEVRLLTLMGPGGVGKTRLALRVAEDVAASFPNGVYFVQLAPIRDPDLVVPTIAMAVGMKGAGELSPLESLKRSLRDSRALLLVDNFEQVVPAAPMLSELLVWCPGVKALVTSREPLHLGGEHLMEVPPLEVPSTEYRVASSEYRVASSEYRVASSEYRVASKEDGPLATHNSLLATIEQYAVVRLFAERARAVSDFTLTEENARYVVEICARLDGLPLAIELAAARARLFSPADIVSRLGRRLELLTSGPRDLPARHRSLHAAIEWSYDLLTEGEQRLFTRMAVFAGGSTLDAVEAVCNAYADLPMSVLDGMASLLDKSLLKRIEGGKDQSSGVEQRFAMLETIREYAAEQLVASGEWDEMRKLHAEFYLALAEATEPELTKARQAVWLEALEREHDNMRAALEWCRTAPSGAEMGLRLAGALFWFWQVRGHLGEGRERLAAALTTHNSLLASNRRTPARAKALFAAGSLALFQGDYGAASAHFEESMEIERVLGNEWGVTFALNGLGRVAEYQGDYDAARTRYEAAREIRERLGNRWGMAGAFNNLGRAAMRQGDLPRARPLLEEGLAIFRELDDRSSIAMLLSNLGVEALRAGEHERAAKMFGESLSLEIEVAYKWGIPFCLVGFAEVACARGDSERAARLLGAAEAMLQTIGARMDPIDRADFERNVTAARAALDVASFDRTWREGSRMDVEEAVEYATEVVRET